MSHKKLLLAGGGYADIPLILSAKKMGFHVITTGNRPDELGHRYSDEYHCADFSDPDVMLQLSKRLGIDAICPCCNDFSALSCAYVAEKLGLVGHDSYDTALIIHHKDRYRNFAMQHGIYSPKAIGFSQSEILHINQKIKSFSFPVIVKPIDLTGGKGISTVSDISQLTPAVEKAFAISRAKRIVIEEFISGTRHGFSAFLRDGKIAFCFFDNEHYFKNPYMVSAASTPSIVSAVVKQKLREQSEKIAKILSLKTGIFHVQYILQNETPIIIEICRRAPGDLYIKLVEHATGLSYSDWIVSAFAGLSCDDISQVEPHGFILRHCVMSEKTGIIKDVIFDDSVKNNVIDKLMWWKKGDQIKDEMVTKLGIIFLKFDSIEEMLWQTEQMQQLIKVETE